MKHVNTYMLMSNLPFPSVLEVLIVKMKIGDQLKCRLIQSTKEYIHCFLSWQSIITFGLAALGIFLYDHLSWMYVQVFLARIIRILFVLSGYPVLQAEDCIFIEDFSFQFTNHCTYINRILPSIPFVLRIEGVGCNVLRVLLFIGMVFAINIIRIYLALTLNMQGIPWKYSHTLFTHVISWSIFLSIIILWLRYLKTKRLGNVKNI